MLDALFMTVLDMTVKGSLVILAVLAARLLLRRAPKVISYGLWLVVLIRLLCPLELSSPVSVLPQIESVSQDYVLEDVPVSIVQVGATAVEIVGNAISGENTQQEIYVVTPEVTPNASPDISTEMKYISVSPKDIWIHLGMYLWAGGMAVMAVYSVVSLLRLKRKLREAVRLEKGVYETDTIASPFVIGLFAPKIYLPVGLEAQERGYILAHEHHHIRRIDPVWKALGFFALCLHWFNPLVWLAFFLGCRDMEMSCDEAVLKQFGAEIRPEYAASLLKISTGKAIVGGTPLAFGEGDTKGRIKNLAKWKKPALWISIAAVLLCGVLAVTLLTDPVHQDGALAGDEHVGRTYFFGTVEELSQDALKLNREGQTESFSLSESIEVADGIEPGTYVKIYCNWDAEGKRHLVAEVTKAQKVMTTDLVVAARQFIQQMERSYSGKNKETFASFVEIRREKTSDGSVILYGLAMHQTYATRNGNLQEISGGHIPVAMTFGVGSDGQYIALEYWMPRDGSLYAEDIRTKFPGGLLPDTQAYVDAQQEECLQAALAHFGMLDDEEGPSETAPENTTLQPYELYGFDMTPFADDKMEPFENLTREYYEMENAAQDGAVIMEGGNGYMNVAIWNKFYWMVQNGNPARVRVIDYRQGIPARALDIFFNGEKFRVREQFLYDGEPIDLREMYFYQSLGCYTGELLYSLGDPYETYVRYGLSARPNGSTEPQWHSGDNLLVFQIRQQYKKHPDLPEHLISAKLMVKDITLGAVFDPERLESLEGMLSSAELWVMPYDSFTVLVSSRPIMDELYLLLQYADGTELRLPMSPENDWLRIGEDIYDYGPGEVVRGDKIAYKNGILDLLRLFGLENWPQEFTDWCNANGIAPPYYSLKILVGEEKN